MGDFSAVIYIVLAIAPFGFLHYYPFLNSLRFSKRIVTGGFCIILLSEIIAFSFFDYVIIPDIVLFFYFVNISFALLAVRKNLYKQLFIMSLIVIYQLLLVGVSIACERWTQPDSGLPPYLVANLIIILQFALTYQIFFKFMREKINSFVRYDDNAVWRWIWLIPACILAIILITKQFTMGVAINLNSILVRIFAGGGALSCCLILIDSIETIREKQRLENDLRLTEKLGKVQENHFRSLSENMAATRKMRHDLHHQLFVLQNYLETGRLRDALQYLRQSQSNLDSQDSSPLCSDMMLDALFKHWLGVAARYGIKTDVRLELPGKLPVDDFDLCVLVGNLMENAGEACQRVKLGERHIDFKMRIVGNMLVLTLDNTFDGTCIFNGDQLLSSKRGYKEPGIGLGSVAAVTNKYNGELKIKQENNIFRVSILLNGMTV